MGHGTPSLWWRRTPFKPVNPRVLEESETEDNSDQEWLIDNETDDHKTFNKENDEIDDDDPHVPWQLNIRVADFVVQLRAMVEWRERIIEFLFQQYT